jgi:hypothetical protein
MRPRATSVAHLNTKPDNTGRFVERPSLSSRPHKAEQRGGTWFESTAAPRNSPKVSAQERPRLFRPERHTGPVTNLSRLGQGAGPRSEGSPPLRVGLIK